jgi:hypothetical protein
LKWVEKEERRHAAGREVDANSPDGNYTPPRQMMGKRWNDFSFKPSGFGKVLKRDNDSSTISSTISKDNTAAERARQAELLAQFGKRKQPMGFAKAFVHMSLEPHPLELPPSMSVQEAWLQQQAQAQLHNDLSATYSVLQAQENSLRLQLYNQSQQYQDSPIYGHQTPSTNPQSLQKDEDVIEAPRVISLTPKM